MDWIGLNENAAEGALQEWQRSTQAFIIAAERFMLRNRGAASWWTFVKCRDDLLVELSMELKPEPHSFLACRNVTARAKEWFVRSDIAQIFARAGKYCIDRCPHVSKRQKKKLCAMSVYRLLSAVKVLFPVKLDLFFFFLRWHFLGVCKYCYSWIFILELL